MKSTIVKSTLATAVAAAIFGTGSYAVAATPDSTGATVSSAIEAVVEDGKNGAELVDVIVVYKTPPGLADKDLPEKLGGKSGREFESLRMRSMRIPAKAITALSKNPNITLIAEDAPVSMSAGSANKTARKPQSVIDGLFTVSPNVGVAVLDSGVGMHKDLNVLKRMDCTLPGGTDAQNLGDDFNVRAYSNNDGSQTWSGSWQETDDDGSPLTG